MALALTATRIFQEAAKKLDRCFRLLLESYLDPIPFQMSGYEDQLIMAGGTFIDGSTSELSADGPLREPYIVFCQGGTHWTHISLILEKIIKEIELCS